MYACVNDEWKQNASFIRWDAWCSLTSLAFQFCIASSFIKLSCFSISMCVCVCVFDDLRQITTTRNTFYTLYIWNWTLKFKIARCAFFSLIFKFNAHSRSLSFYVAVKLRWQHLMRTHLKITQPFFIPLSICILYFLFFVSINWICHMLCVRWDWTFGNVILDLFFFL